MLAWCVTHTWDPSGPELSEPYRPSTARHVQQHGQLPHKGLLLLLCQLPNTNLQDELHQTILLRVWLHCHSGSIHV